MINLKSAIAAVAIIAATASAGAASAGEIGVTNSYTSRCAKGITSYRSTGYSLENGVKSNTQYAHKSERGSVNGGHYKAVSGANSSSNSAFQNYSSFEAKENALFTESSFSHSVSSFAN